MDHPRCRLCLSLLTFLLFTGVPPTAADPATPSSLPNLGSATVRARTAALLVSDLMGGELPARATAVVWPGEEEAEEGETVADEAGEAVDDHPADDDAAEDEAGEAILLVVLELDGAALLGVEKPAVAEAEAAEGLQALEIFLYLIGEGDQVVHTTTLHTRVTDDARRAFRLRREAWREAGSEAVQVAGLPGQAGVRLRAALPVVPGRYQLRYLARLEDGPFALGSLPVEVPLAPVEPPSWLAAPVGVWLDIEPPPGPWPLEPQDTPAAEPVGDGRGLVWADVLPEPGAGPVEPPPRPSAALPAGPGSPDAAPEAVDDRLETELAAGVRRVLELLATADGEDAAEHLAELEARAVPVAETGALETLARVERQVAGDVLEALPEARWSLVELHRQAAHHHRLARRTALAAHALDRAVALAQGGDGGDAQAPALAALASDLRRAGRARQAGELLERSLRLREVVTTRLALAALAERRGDVHRVEELLSPVARHGEPSPEDDRLAYREALLRLAVCYSRQGETERARTLLQPLARQAEEPWLRQVALQELVALWLDRGHCGRAESALRKALAAEPRQAQWRVLMIRARQCRGAHGEARELAFDTLAGGATRDGLWQPSPRGRYGEFPEQALEPARLALTRHAEEARRRLVAWWGDRQGPETAGLGGGRGAP